MPIILRGCTRIVILLGRFAIKIPQIRYGTEFFVNGQFHILRERRFWKTFPPKGREYLCPCYFCLPFGLFSVMRRAEHIPDDDPNGGDYHNLLVSHGYGGMDSKNDNLGRIDGNLVILDYGDLSFYWCDPDSPW